MLDRILNRLEEWIIAVLIGAATIITFVAVIHRYGASNSAVLVFLGHGSRPSLARRGGRLGL